MNSICGLCGNENISIGKEGICGVCEELQKNYSVSKEDICIITRSLFSSISDAF